MKENIKNGLNEVVMNNVNRYIWLCNSIRMADTIQDVQNIYTKIEDNEDNQNLVTELAYIIDDNKEIISTDAELAIAEIIDEIYNALEYNASFLQSQGVDTDKSYTWAFPIVYPFITLSDNNMLHSLFSEYIKGVINKYSNKYPGMNRCMECNLINMIDSIADYIINTTEDKLITSDEQYAFSRNNSKNSNHDSKQEIKEVSELVPNDIDDYNYFGTSVAMSSDGLQAIVGSSGNDTKDVLFSGAVYIYTRATVNDPWVKTSKLVTSDTNKYDYFGWSVAMSSDGLQIMVGASGKSTSGYYRNGAVYTYRRKTINSEWIEISKLENSSPISQDCFGTSIAMSGNGLYAVISGNDKYSDENVKRGMVHIYSRETIDAPWVESSRLMAEDNDKHMNFGSAVAISSDGLEIMVGASGKSTGGQYKNGVVYLYNRKTIDSPWTKTSKLVASVANDNDEFGSSIAISENGLRAAIGACNKNIKNVKHGGQVYLYSRETTDDPWVEVDKLIDSNVANNDYFGCSVAMSNDGSHIMVGSRGKNINDCYESGLVYTYNIKQSNVEEKQEINEESESTGSNRDHYDYASCIVHISSDSLQDMISGYYKDNDITDIGQIDMDDEESNTEEPTDLEQEEEQEEDEYDVVELLKYFEMFTTVTGAISKEQSISEIAADICISLAKIIANGNMLVITNFDNEILLNIASNNMTIVDMLFKHVITFNLLSYDYDEQETRADLINYFNQFDGNELEPLRAIKQAIDNSCV